MARKLKDWLAAYVNYASFSEAPTKMHFWTGVSAIAGALRRRVWFDMAYFKWYPNFFIILVAPPGIVSKSTTADIGMNLLREVDGIHFGPDVITWQALVKSFADCSEFITFPNGDHVPMSAMTIVSSEFGNLLNPQDREMVDLYVTLWDSKQGAFSKVTKMSGSDSVENPWINVIACTTPAWIAGNFPEYIIGGGFTSRCLFVYADKKKRLVAYPHLDVPKDMEAQKQALIHDLEHMAVNLLGEYTITKEALEWGQTWYEDHYNNRPEGLSDDRFGGYIARKQTHVHKLAMILSASSSDSQVITVDDLKDANIMVTELEADMPQVFAKIGKSQESLHVDRFLKYVEARRGVTYSEAYRYLHAHFPDGKGLEDMLAGCLKSGRVALDSTDMKLKVANE